MRLTVYVPEDLARQLDTHKGQVNVSRIFQEALSQEFKIMNMTANDESITRLVQSRLRHEAELTAEGRADGVQWATRSAEWRELVALNDAVDELLRAGLTDIDVNVQDYGINRLTHDGRDNELGIMNLSDPWCLGFYEGAMEVMAKVEAAEVGTPQD